MHPLQSELLTLSKKEDLTSLSLRGIAKKLGREEYPQRIKHHLTQLEQRGFLRRDAKTRRLLPAQEGLDRNTNLYAVPVCGTVSCGPATAFATENIEGFLMVSKRILPKQKDLFALRATGQSMNRAKINGNSVDEGDFVIIDKDQTPKDGDYVISVINGCANLKKFVRDEKNNRLLLISESNKEFLPIIIHPEDDYNYLINGVAVQVIKKATA